MLVRISKSILILVLSFGLPLSAEEMTKQPIVHLTVKDFLSADGQASKYLGKYVNVSGYALVEGRDNVGLSYAIYEKLEDLNSLGFDAGNNSLPILDKTILDVFSVNHSGCFVSITGLVKAHPSHEDIFGLDDILSVNRTGYFYRASKEKLRQKGIDGEPKCISEVLVNMMAEKKESLDKSPGL